MLPNCSFLFLPKPQAMTSDCSESFYSCRVWPYPLQCTPFTSPFLTKVIKLPNVYPYPLGNIINTPTGEPLPWWTDTEEIELALHTSSEYKGPEHILTWWKTSVTPEALTPPRVHPSPQRDLAYLKDMVCSHVQASALEPQAWCVETGLIPLLYHCLQRQQWGPQNCERQQGTSLSPHLKKRPHLPEDH